MAKKVILWTTPRSLSNAVLCSMSTLKNTKHFHELFTGTYFYLPAGPFDPSSEPHLSPEDFTYDGVKKTLLTNYPGMELVFTKEMAFCLPESMYEEMTSGDFAEFNHTFLIRDPERAIYSYYKGMRDEGKDLLVNQFEIIETFYPKMYKLYNFVKEKMGSTPVVIDAVNLQTHPEETMKSYCDALGIQFDSKMLSWEPGRFVPRLKNWSSKNVWLHSVVLQSSGFIKTNPMDQKPVPINDLPKEIQKHIEDGRFYYNELQRACLKP